MLFPAWETFYIVLGSAAGALTGLMFVVVALIADMEDGTEDALHAYATPTVVHFGGVLVLSMLLVTPWPALLHLTAAVALFGVAGTIYMLIVWRRVMKQTKIYKPFFEDWLFYTALPIAAYVTVLVAAGLLRLRTTAGLFVTAAGAVLLLCVGIHNAWDTVIYIAVGRREAERDAAKAKN